MARLIDREPNTRVKPMRLLCMGLGRTGTHSLHIALRKLGYNPYHTGAEGFKNPPRDWNLWIEALQSNFFHTDAASTTPRYGREEFDRLMGPFDACLDFPTCLFWEDLHAAYPDAKVILTVRDVDPWLRSVTATLIKFTRSPLFRLWSHIDSRSLGPLYRKLNLVWRVFCGGCFDEDVLRQAYLDHNERVRRGIPREQFLELRVAEGRDGWEELCRFLEVPVPDEPWPRAYCNAEFQVDFGVAYWGVWMALARWVGVCVVVVVGGAWLVGCYMGGGYGVHDEV